MNHLDERLTFRSKVVESLKVSFPWLAREVKSIRIPRTNKYETEKLSDDSDEQVDLNFRLAAEKTSEVPALEELVSSGGVPLPYTIYLGLCDDGLPLTLNLTNPAPGSILIAGDSESGKTRLLRSVLSSVTMTSPADQVLFFILAKDRHEYTDIAELDNCKKLLAYQDKAAARLIPDLFEEIEKRRTQSSDLVVILAIEELAQYLHTLDASLLSQLLRLVKHGPRLGIWVLATLSSADLDQIDPAVVEAFRTHLIGYLADAVQTTYLAHDPTCPAAEISKGIQWLVSMSGYWVPFRICDPGGGV